MARIETTMVSYKIVTHFCEVGGCDFETTDPNTMTFHEYKHTPVPKRVAVIGDIPFYRVESKDELLRAMVEVYNMDSMPCIEGRCEKYCHYRGPGVYGFTADDLPRGCQCGCVDYFRVVKPLIDYIEDFDLSKHDRETLDELEELREEG